MSEPRYINEHFGGYYYETNNINYLNDPYTCLLTIKSSVPQVGEYILIYYIDNNDTNNNIVKLYKYIRWTANNNGLDKININNYLYFYRGNNDVTMCKYINNNIVNDFTLSNSGFLTGLTGNDIPDNTLGNIDNYYLNINTGYVYYKIEELKWVRIIKCLSINYYDNTIDRFNVYINLDEIEPIVKKIIYSEQEYQGYQGILASNTTKINYNDENIPTNIINIIKNLKFNRSTIIGDSLLCQYNDGVNILYKIFVVVNINAGFENVKIIDLPSKYFFII